MRDLDLYELGSKESLDEVRKEINDLFAIDSYVESFKNDVLEIIDNHLKQYKEGNDK